MIELRFHGRFGQPVGKVTRAIANQLMTEGKHVQVFDSFAAFRPGNPMFSTLRVSEEVIRERSTHDTYPDVVLVLDNSLFKITDVTKGLKSGGTVMALRESPEVLGESVQKVQFIPLDSEFLDEEDQRGDEKVRGAVDPAPRILRALKKNNILL